MKHEVKFTEAFNVHSYVIIYLSQTIDVAFYELKLEAVFIFLNVDRKDCLTNRKFTTNLS
jgi:hypothetical protein